MGCMVTGMRPVKQEGGGCGESKERRSEEYEERRSEGAKNTGAACYGGRIMPIAAPARTFQDLVVWQKAHRFVVGIYSLTASFPKQEIYGLTNQLRRAAVSVPANIAEGFRRRGRADKARFLNIAEASLDECKYYLILAKDLAFCDPQELTSLVDEVVRLLSAYTRAILRA
jgi:four helix bundle protein